MTHVHRTVAIALAATLMACSNGDNGGNNDTAEDDNNAEAAEEEIEEALTEAREEDENDESSGSEPTGDEAVMQDYLAAMDAIVAAYDPPNPEHPDLLTYFAGQALETNQVRLANYRVDGLSLVAVRAERDPEVIRRVSTQATVADCIVEDLEFRDVETGEVRDTRHDEGVIESALEQSEDGVWQIVEAEITANSC